MSDITGIEDNYIYDKPEDAIHALEMKVLAYQKGVKVGKGKPAKALEAWGSNTQSQIENFVEEIANPSHERYEIYEQIISTVVNIWRKDSEYYW